jgi:hypothetical protein
MSVDCDPNVIERVIASDFTDSNKKKSSPSKNMSRVRISIDCEPNVIERIIASESCPEAKVESAFGHETIDDGALGDPVTGFQILTHTDQREKILHYVSPTPIPRDIDSNILHSLLTKAPGTVCLYVAVQASVVWYICQQLNTGQGISVEFLIGLILKNRSFAAQSHFDSYLFWSRLDTLQTYVLHVHCADKTAHLTQRHLWAFPLNSDATRRAVEMSTAIQQLVTFHKLLVVYRDKSSR